MYDPNNKDNDSDSTRNLMLAVMLSLAVFLGFDYITATFFPHWRPAPEPVVQQVVSDGSVVPASNGALPAAQNLNAGQPDNVAGLPVAPMARRIAISSPHFNGSISTRGARIDQLSLPEFHTEVNGEKDVTLFRPNGAQAHFFDAGWLTSGTQEAPDGNTIWHSDSSVLAPSQPVTFTWANADQQLFTRTYTLDAETYAINVSDTVRNNASLPAAFTHYAQVHKTGVEASNSASFYSQETSTWINFIGPLGLFDDEKKEVEYDDLKEDGSVKAQAVKGWIGMTSRYFLAALVPDQQNTQHFLFRYSIVNNRPFYTTMVQPATATTLQPSEEASVKTTLYAGPKQVASLEKLPVQLDRAVDYGWFHFIARPLFDVVMWLSEATHNVGWAIILTTVLLKLLLYPLANKSYASMARMKKIQPQMQRLKEQHADNPMEAQMKVIALFKEHKVNPAGGCLPMLVQIPIFYAFYKMILLSFEFRHTPFLSGWIDDLSSPDPFYILPVLTGLVMLGQWKLSSATVTEPFQKQLFLIMNVAFSVFCVFMPAGLVLYWFTNMGLSVLQQGWMMKKHG